MNNKFISAMCKIEPDPALKEKTYNKIFNGPQKKKKWIVPFTSAAAIVLCVALGISLYFTTLQKNSITIPIPSTNINLTATTNAIPSLIYKHKCYIYSGNVNYEEVQKLLGRELGATIWYDPGLRESISADEAKNLPDFTTTSSAEKIYSLKGCDTDVRLIGIAEFDGKKYAMTFDSPYGLTIRSGKDFFGKIVIGKAQTAEYRTSYNDGEYRTEEKTMDNSKLKILDEFVKKLDTAKPYEFTDGFSTFRQLSHYKVINFYDENGIPTCLILWKNEDGCFVSFSGYCYNIIFTVDKDTFDALWEITD